MDATWRLFGLTEIGAVGLVLGRMMQLFSSDTATNAGDCSIYLVEGIIGVGKSTLCSRFEGVDRVRMTREHVGERFLEEFNKDRGRFAFALQMTQQAKRQATLELARATPNVASVLDRSVVGDFAFALWNACSRNLDRDEWQLYLEAAGRRPSVPLDPRIVVVFLNDDVDSCSLRQQRRDQYRIDHAYLSGLEAAHLVCLALLPASVRIIELTWTEYGRAQPTPDDTLGMMRGELLTHTLLMDRRTTLEQRTREAIKRVVSDSARSMLQDFFDTELAATRNNSP